MTALGPLVESAGIAWKGISWKPEQEVEELRHRNGVVARRRRRRAPELHARRPRRRDDLPALSGTTNGRLAVEGFRALEQRTGDGARRPRRGPRGRADHARAGPHPAAQGHHLAGVVGDREPHPPLLAVHRQRRPRRALAHADRPPALLPRPRLDARVRRGAAGLPPAAARVARHEQGELDPGDAEVLVKWITPALEVVDPLRVPGQPADARAVPRRAGRLARAARTPSGSRSRDNDWVEIVNRNGVDRLPRRRLPPHPRRQRVHVPLAGPARERARSARRPATAAAPTTRSRGS